MLARLDCDIKQIFKKDQNGEISEFNEEIKMNHQSSKKKKKKKIKGENFGNKS